MYPFGKTITAEFYPLIDNAEVTQTDIDAMVIDHIYLFSYTSGKPSLDTARAGTGSLQDVTAWTAVPEKRGFRYALAAIADPDPEGSTLAYSYWVAINFKWATGQQIQTVLNELILERVWGHQRRIGVAFQDVVDAWPMADKYATTTQILAYIELARSDIRNELRAKGYEFAEIRRPDRLSRAVLYATLSQIAFGQIAVPSDHWHEQSKHWRGMSTKIVNELRFEYDGVKSGATQTTDTQGGYRFINR